MYAKVTQTKTRKSFKAPRSLSNTERGDSQESGFIGILAAALIVIAAIIYFFGTDTLVNWITRLLGVV